MHPHWNEMDFQMDTSDQTDPKLALGINSTIWIRSCLIYPSLFSNFSISISSVRWYLQMMSCPVFGCLSAAGNWGRGKILKVFHGLLRAMSMWGDQNRQDGSYQTVTEALYLYTCMLHGCTCRWKCYNYRLCWVDTPLFYGWTSPEKYHGWRKKKGHPSFFSFQWPFFIDWLIKWWVQMCRFVFLMWRK